MLSVCLLASGKLGYNVLCEIYNEYKIPVIFTDKFSADIINFCLSNNIAHYIGNPRNGKTAHLIAGFKIDVLLSVNYIFLIEQDLINWPNKYAINLHGSLLPKYRGRTPHVWSIINNEKTTGITAHVIDEGCDTGAIIDQVKVSIDESDTGAGILEKFNLLYPEFVKRVLKEASKGTIQLKQQDHLKATYFGKRTPEDGKINWDWQRERIYNWVRAQAYPYPGAFCFYDDKKITINRIVFSDYGFIDSIPNGTILDIEQDLPIIKTQNGAIKVADKFDSGDVIFQKGKMFV